MPKDRVTLFVLALLLSAGTAAASKVNAIVLFETASGSAGPCMAGLQSFRSPQKALHFPWFENSTDFWTGIAVLNVNDFPVTVFFRAVEPDGTKHESATLSLTARQRIVQYPGTLFPGGLPAETNLHCFASGPVAGFLILHNLTLSKAEAINGVPDTPVTPTLKNPPVTFADLTGDDSTNLRFSPDGSRVYVRGVYRMRVYDRYSGALLYLRPSDYGDWGPLAITPDGRYLFTANMSTGELYRFDTGSFTESLFLNSAAATGLDCSPDGRYLGIVTNSSIFVWDLAANQLVDWATFTGGTTFTDCKFTADSRFLLATDSSARKLYVTSMSLLARMTIDLTQRPTCLAQDPSTGHIYVGCSEISNNLLIFENQTFYPVGSPLTASGAAGLIYHIAVSPDGRQVYTGSVLGDNCLWVYDTLMGTFISPGIYPFYSNFVSPTPEGDQLFFVSYQAVKCIN